MTVHKANDILRYAMAEGSEELSGVAQAMIRLLSDLQARVKELEEKQ